VLCGVFDGHGVEGHLVSGFLKEKIPMHFSRSFKKGVSDYENLLS